MSYTANNPNGQATMANSAPVVVASNQSSIPVTLADGADGAIGSKADAVATTDNGAFSQIALIKRMLTNMIKALDVDNAPLTNTKPGIVGGKAIDVTAPTAFTTGDAVIDVHDNATGAKVVLQADTIAKFDSITISEKITTSEYTITRPANVTPYTADDQIGGTTTAMIQFSNVATLASDGKDSSGYIVGLTVATSDTGMINKTLRLIIFDGSLSYLVNDNVVYGEAGVNNLKAVVDQIDIPIINVTGGAAYGKCILTNLRIPYKTNGQNSLYGVLTTKEGFTPSADSTQIYLKITVTKND